MEDDSYFEEEGFVPIEDVVGPTIEYHIDPHERIKINPILGRVVVLSEPTGLWAINEKTQAKIKN